MLCGRPSRLGDLRRQQPSIHERPSTTKTYLMRKRQRVVTGSDSLPALEAGWWAEDKHFALNYFMDIFNGGMKNLWPQRAYIDLFSGPGRCHIRDTLEETDGSPLLALKQDPPFTHYFFNDIDPSFIEALKTRSSGLQSNINYYSKDCNEVVEEIRNDYPSGALGLAFIDPWNWAISFDSVYRLTENRRIDLIIIFHTGSIKRNATHVLAKLDAFIGDSVWRTKYLDSLKRGERRGSRIILDHYEQRLKDIAGYNFVDDRALVTISTGLPLYHLVYASRNPTGADFWNKSIRRKRSGQRRLF